MNKNLSHNFCCFKRITHYTFFFFRSFSINFKKFNLPQKFEICNLFVVIRYDRKKRAPMLNVTMQCGLCNVDYTMWTMKCGPCNVDHKMWTMQRLMLGQTKLL